MSNFESALQNIYVFVARYPFDVLSDFLPQERQREIDLYKNERARLSKYYAFKLLEHALKEVFGANMKDCNLTSGKNGKWTCDICEFSVSHCENIVAVAVASRPVGVDVEKVNLARFDEKLQRRILNEIELSSILDMTEAEKRNYANRLWTVKEAEFKRNGGTRFVASAINTADVLSRTMLLESGGSEYYLSVACDCERDISFAFVGEGLKFAK